jgi:hypothetical protein
MTRNSFFDTTLVLLIVIFLGSSAHAEGTCPVPSAWLPTTPLPTNDTPPPHNAPDCPFYRAAWQNFMYVMQPGSDGRPRFLSSYSTIADLFGAPATPQFAEKQIGVLSLAPRIAQFPNEKLLHALGNPPGIDAGVNQAGPLRGLLIDQNGDPIYYAVHVNDVYSNFIKQNELTTKAALLNADPEKIEFPEGAVELKSAWQIVTPNTRRSDYFITKALVPNLKLKDGDVVIDSSSREVEVALIAIHVVFVLKAHPEFIWSTFEHLNPNGVRDNAPAATANPSTTSGTTVISGADWPLYKAGTVASSANVPNSTQDRFNHLDEKTQAFNKGGNVLQSSVYRMFPGSKSSETAEDDDVTAVNGDMQKLFSASHLDPIDRRQHYQLVGAIWLDNPGRDFKSKVLFRNQDGQTTDTPGAMVAGEDRLSSTAMESFTQADDGRPNCFSCHNTTRVTDDKTGTTVIPAKRLNVSHVISKFLSEVQ